jgi:hypothetical protein
LRRLASAVGLSRALDLKIVEYFDFFPTDRGFKGMKERCEFPRTSTDDYLWSLFHIVQATGNAELASVIAHHRGADRALVRLLLSDLRAGKPIEGRLSPEHFGIAHANFTSDQILAALAASEPARQS